jgi:integrase
MISATLPLLIEQHEWLDIPERVITREGVIANISGDLWQLPLPSSSGIVDFSCIENPLLKWATKRRVIHRAETTSTHAAVQEMQSLKHEFIAMQHEYELGKDLSSDQIKDPLISLVEKAIFQARAKHRLWALYRPIQWYIWCAENYPELGFCPVFAMELDGMVIPGNPKGEAVRMEDPDRGPLHRSLEVPLLINALRDDTSQELEHLQQKAALALAIALGRNPTNLTYLRESDFVTLAPDSESPCHIIKMPRIKKRQLHPRDDLLEEYLDPQFAKHIQDLVIANKSIKCVVDSELGPKEIERPIFISQKVNPGAGKIDDSYNMTYREISQLIRGFILRHDIISPLTGEILQISPRRLRYTLATSLAAEGISRRELARLLDHTDTQHVQVYFELAGTIVEHLDKATAKGFAKYLDLFKGKIIDQDGEAVNGHRDDKHLSFVNELNPKDQIEIGICGERSICHLDPPFSCYLCPKFQPYRHADHENVLECLLASREERIEKYENARLGIQLDQVIIAVAQVAEQCKKEVTHG